MNKPVKYGLFLTLTIAAVEIVTIFIYELLTKNIAFYSLLNLALLVLFAFISSTILTTIIINTVPYFKKFLQGHRSLMRFQNLSHPLLLRLSFEAPGTYHHSLNVANLAYKGAQAINADAILSRTGAYYHDIGKLKNPEIFIENKKFISQKNEPQTFTELKKQASEILEHVHYGISIAKEYKLPAELTAFVAEHHGTTAPIYFFEKVKKLKPDFNTNKLSYPGPKPLSKECAIVMLADAIEAKLRLVKNINKNKIIENVDKIITDRLSQRQLELSGLSKSDIDKIRDAFIETLSSIHHQRISYKNNE